MIIKSPPSLPHPISLSLFLSVTPFLSFSRTLTCCPMADLTALSVLAASESEFVSVYSCVRLCVRRGKFFHIILITFRNCLLLFFLLVSSTTLFGGFLWYTILFGRCTTGDSYGWERRRKVEIRRGYHRGEDRGERRDEIKENMSLCGSGGDWTVKKQENGNI